jgi:tetratricopeptide (TPR) repeat protein
VDTKPDIGDKAPFESSRSPAGGTTPRFARIAAGLLEAGDVQGALRICLAGARMFPRYPTGRLILGRCYDALGRDVEAMLEYQRVIDVYPDNPVVGALVRNAEEHERRGFEEFAALRLAKLHGRKDRLTFEEYVGATGDSPQTTSVERIIRQLEDAPRRIPPPPAGEEPPPPPIDTGEPSGRFVTATLAEIYASQGEYDEAIEAYRKLAEQRPGSAGRYQKRLGELEELKRLRDGEQFA